MDTYHGSCRQRGFSLVEALVAFLILTAGLLLLLSFHGAAQNNNADAKIQAEAVALAEQKLNELAALIAIGTAGLAPVSDGPCPGTAATASISGLTDFEFRCDIGGDNPRSVRVAVTWQDNNGRPRRAVMASRVRVSEPAGDVAGLIALVRAAEQGRQSVALWPPAATEDDGDEDAEVSDEEDGGGEEGDPPDDEEQDPPRQLTLHTLSIRGAVDNTASGGAGGTASLAEVAAHSPLSGPGTCVQPAATSFRCTVTYLDPRAGWTGSVVLTAAEGRQLRAVGEHEAACGQSLHLLFEAITGSVDEVRLEPC